MREAWLVVLATVAWSAAWGGPPPFLGQGELVGEVTPTSAIVRTRLTLREKPEPGEGVPLPEDLPGAPGRVRVVYGMDQSLADAKATDWRAVDEKTNFATQFALGGLQPRTRYFYRAECRATDAEDPALQGPVGEFSTAPAERDAVPVRFCAITCQAMRSRDLESPGGPKGFQSYVSMAAMKPDFVVSTGDSVYYDLDGPIHAVDERLARYHWDRIYGLPTVQSLFRVTSGYWEKDDHDYRWDDSGPNDPVPGKKRIMLSDEVGRRVFREAVPMGENTWRTFTWGRGLQIWLVEGRDFRSPNKMPDGPDKSIWGTEQKAWLKQTLKASTCRYKILVSPTPLVGPDRDTKGDNHANEKGFRTEGREFLEWVKSSGLEGFSIVCGDRHWQYHSVDPESGVKEFCTGPISDLHVTTKPSGHNPAYHRYYNLVGGFFSISVEPKGESWQIIFRHHSPDGKVTNEAVDP